MKNSQPLRKEGYMEREERQAIYQVSTCLLYTSDAADDS